MVSYVGMSFGRCV